MWQIRRKLRIWTHLLKLSLMENFICCGVVGALVNCFHDSYCTWNYTSAGTRLLMKKVLRCDVSYDTRFKYFIFGITIIPKPMSECLSKILKAHTYGIKKYFLFILTWTFQCQLQLLTRCSNLRNEKSCRKFPFKYVSTPSLSVKSLKSFFMIFHDLFLNLKSLKSIFRITVSQTRRNNIVYVKGL